jgi:erythromycin esterase
MGNASTPAATAAPANPHTVSGQVRLAGGAPAEGALVALAPHFELEYPGPTPRVPMVIADAQGRYAFPMVEVGRYGVTATLGTKAVAAYAGAHDLTASTRLTVDLTLGREGFPIGGTVRSAEGAPASGARIEAVRLSDNEGEVFMTTTDAAGRYEIQLANDASYFLVADVRGLPRAWRRIEPAAQTVDFRLDRAPAPRPADAEIKAYLVEQALPLVTAQPGKGTTDLAPFKKMIGDAHIVAIGEPVHGSSEFWLLRHRLIELLTTELGFTTVALEAGWSDALPLDDYVTNGRGDPLKGLADLYYWYPNTEETLAIVRWMRRYNQDPAHAQKLHFRGFDVEFTSHAVAALVAYLDKVDAPLASRAREFLMPLREVMAESTYQGVLPIEQEKTQQGIREVLARFETDGPKWKARSSERAWVTAREHAQMLRRTESVYRDSSKRDAAMAETVEAIIDREPRGSKVLLLGHNFHMSAQRVQLSEMGQLLRERHGNDYFVIGTTFGTGSLHAYAEKKAGQPPGPRPVDTFSLGPPPPGGLEAALALTERSLFALDLRRTTGPVGDWLASKMSTRSVGGVFHGEANADTRCAPKKSYDALIYIDKVTASHLNPGAN